MYDRTILICGLIILSGIALVIGNSDLAATGVGVIGGILVPKEQAPK